MSTKRPTSTADDTPCCWLCLEDGPDDSGKPLCRDCSCRGTSGFAHLSCALKYAERKGKEAYETNGDLPFEHFFETCPNCNQGYQGDVRYAFSTARIDFVEREYKNDLLSYLFALLDKLNHLTRWMIKRNNSLHPDEQHAREGEDICSKVLSVLASLEQRTMESHETHVSAAANFVVGEFFERISSLEKAKEHFIQAKDLYEELGGDESIDVTSTERKIRIVEAKICGTEVDADDMNMKEEIVHWRERYKDEIQSAGEGHLDTLNTGFLLFRALYCERNYIEAERLLSKMVNACRRVHGVEHDQTKHYSAVLQQVKVREVEFVTSLGDNHSYQALRYENNGEKIVVQGPLSSDERELDEEKTMTINSKDAIPHPGTPVVCVNSMSDLNGKIGVVRDYYSHDDITCEIHFEEEGLNPTEVKCENLRILFDLPEKETEDSL